MFHLIELVCVALVAYYGYTHGWWAKIVAVAKKVAGWFKKTPAPAPAADLNNGRQKPWD